ncbi:hypothetical protein BGX24_006839 [Mortierella sp. AD032]|nr:hypothetical protein BGX24_006839 [Mortierella sp. AD032]
MLNLLDIQIYSSRLVIHSELLTRCLSLTYVKLADRTFGYRYQDMEPCQSAQPPNLKVLALWFYGIENDMRLGTKSFRICRPSGDPDEPEIDISFTYAVCIPTLRHLNLRERWIVNDAYMFGSDVEQVPEY